MMNSSRAQLDLWISSPPFIHGSEHPADAAVLDEKSEWSSAQSAARRRPRPPPPPLRLSNLNPPRNPNPPFPSIDPRAERSRNMGSSPSIHRSEQSGAETWNPLLSIHRSEQETKKPDGQQSGAETGDHLLPIHRSEQETKKPDAQQSGAETGDHLLPSMEANKFGFGSSLPPAFKFDPTDADIVAYYLLPRALNLPNPYACAIIEDDPCTAPPWEILQRHGNLEHAFFFGPPTDPSQNGGRRRRDIQGGVWKTQRSYEDTVTLLRPGGGEVDIRYKRYNLSFSIDKHRARSTGYIMDEYEIISPPLPGTVLTRIKVKKANRKSVAPAAAKQQVPEQTGPSYENYAAMLLSNGEGFGGTLGGAPYGDNYLHHALWRPYGGVNVENADYYSSPLRYVPPEANYYAASYNYDAAAINGEGFTGAQAHAFYGGGMVDTSGAIFDPSGYAPECCGDYSNYYAEYQQWPNQQDPSNRYHAGDAAVMCTGGEGFSGEQQAGPLCGNSDNGSVVGTETGAHSTISLCGDGEVACDDLSFYNFLVRRQQLLQRQGRPQMCEQKGACDPALQLVI